eukprot:3213017-Rhodomonas_salina.1
MLPVKHATLLLAAAILSLSLQVDAQLSNGELQSIVDVCKDAGWQRTSEPCIQMEQADTSAVTSMARLFFGASSFNGDLSAWKTGAVTDMGA